MISTQRVSNILNKYKIAIFYSSSSIIKALSTLVAGVVIAKYVLPEDLGLWTTLSLLITYSMFFQGGIINGLNLELPLAFGEGKEQEGKQLASIGQTFTLYSSIVVFLIGTLLCFFYPFESLKYRYGVFGVFLIIIITFYQNYLLSTFRSNSSFLKLSYLQIIDAFTNLVTLILIFYFAFYGMLLKAIIALLIFVVLLHFNRPLKVNFTWNKNAFLRLIKTGLPIFGLSYFESLVLTLDKLLLIQFTDFRNLGIYSFALYALAFSTLFSNAIASYVYPKMTYQYGKDKNKLVLWSYVKKITIGLLLLQIPIFILGYFLIPKAIVTFFPNYIESILPMQMLLWAGVMKGSVIGVNVIWSMKKWNYMIFYQVLYSLLLIVCIFLFIKLFNNKVCGVAFGVMIANTLNLFSGIFFSYKATHVNVK